MERSWLSAVVGALAILLVSGTVVLAASSTATAVQSRNSSNAVEASAPSDIVGMTAGGAQDGYWLVGADGGVFAQNGAPFEGSVPGLGIHVSDIVGIASIFEQGYWVAGSDGGVFSFGNAPFDGSLPALGVHVSDIVGIAEISSPSGMGYLLVGADGGVFAFGGASFEGSLPGLGVHVSDIVGIAPTADGGGYWLVGADGGVFAFGDARYEGSIPGTGIHSSRIVGIAPGDDAGYWLVGADGGVFTFGDASFHGSAPGSGVQLSNIVGTATFPNGQGYWVVGAGGSVLTFSIPEVLADCTAAPPEGTQPQLEPSSIAFACADNNYGVEDLVWTSWTNTTAIGTGIVWQNNCTINCAEGTLSYYPATVTLTDVKDTVIGPLFSELNAVYQASGGPFGFSSELFTLPLPPE